MPTPLETSRLTLRGIGEADLPALQQLLQDREVNTFLPWFPVSTPGADLHLLGVAHPGAGILLRPLPPLGRAAHWLYPGLHGRGARLWPRPAPGGLASGPHDRGRARADRAAAHSGLFLTSPPRTTGTTRAAAA